MRKPKPGICGICGVAPIQPETVIPDGRTWVSGHLYDFDGNLMKVRCLEHAEEFDPRWMYNRLDQVLVTCDGRRFYYDC